MKNSVVQISAVQIRALIWVLLALALALLYGYWSQNKSFRLETNILKLLPATDVDPFVDLAFQRFSLKNAKKIVLIVEHAKPEVAKAAALELQNSLSASGVVKSFDSELTVEQQQQVAQLNFEHRHFLLSQNDRQRLSLAEFDQIANDVVETAYSPFAGGVLAALEQDPFLLSYRYSTSIIEQSGNNFKLEGKQLVSRTEARTAVLLSAELNSSPFDRQAQSVVFDAISAAEKQWTENGLLNVDLYRTGAVFYASDAEKIARSEISLFGGLSIVLIVLLVLLVFVNLKPLLMSGISLAFGIATGFAAVHWWFGGIHLITLVFGASLIGISIDYAFHYFTTSGKTGAEKISHIFPAITIGVVSSIVGYLVVLTTPFPGLQQMGLFCIAGLSGAYLSVVLLFPVLSTPSQAHNKWVPLCSRFLAMGGHKNVRITWLLLLALIPLALYVLLFGESEKSDVRAFQPKNTELARQERIIQDFVQAPAGNQFYLVRANSKQALLEQLEFAEQILKEKKDAGVIGGYICLTQWLPSIKRQQQDYELTSKLVHSGVQQELVSNGLVTQAGYTDYLEMHHQDRNNFLSVDEWLLSPIGERFDHLWLGRIEGEYASIIPLKDIRDLNALADINNQITFVDKIGTLNKLLNDYKEKASWLLLFAIATIFLVLLVRFKLRRAAIAISLPLIAVSISVLGIVASGQPLSLFNAIALFLVVGIGVDYAVFFAEMKQQSGNTFLAVSLSAFTTLFTFGMLAMSQVYVISAFGLTVLLGILAAYICSPVIAALTQGENRNAEQEGIK